MYLTSSLAIIKLSPDGYSKGGMTKTVIGCAPNGRYAESLFQSIVLGVLHHVMAFPPLYVPIGFGALHRVMAVPPLYAPIGLGALHPTICT